MRRSVLFVDHAEGLGGAERSLLLLMKELRSLAWYPHLACGSERVADVAAEAGIPAVVMRLPRLRGSLTVLRDLIRGAKEIVGEANSVGAEILHANTLRGAAYTAVASMWNERPFIWHMRDLSMREPYPAPARYQDWTDRLEKRWLAAVAQRIVCNSEAVAASFPFSTKVEVVRNGLDLSRYDPALSGSGFRRQYGIPDDVCLVGTVGRLRPWKRHDRFIRVASRIAIQDPEARFIVTGGAPLESGGSCRDELETLAAELDLGPRLLFTGHLGDVRPALAAFDVFVHSGEPEPFGLVNIEAMAMALPVVAFSHGALPEIVDHQRTGCLVSPGDLDEMTAAVLELLRHPERRRLWGQRGRAKVERQFTIARVAGEMAEIYESLILAPSS